MTVLDFHPDDLLDRSAKGLLSMDERKRLHDHLSQCPVCRLELQVRADFSAELASREEAASMQRFVSDALLATRAAGPVPDAARLPFAAASHSAAPSRRLRRSLAMGLAATLLFASGLAMAQQLGLSIRAVELAQDALGLTRPARSSASATRRTKIGTHSARAPLALQTATKAAPEMQGVAPEVQPALEPKVAAPQMAAAQKPRRSTARIAAGAGFSGSQERTPSLPLSPPPASSSEKRGSETGAESHGLTTPSSHNSKVTEAFAVPVPPERAQSLAATLFEQANAARRQGRWREARAAYQELRAHYADSTEARLSLVVTGRVELDRGEHKAALRDFEAYLSTSDPSLREEALVGRAMALQRLGRIDEQREALRELLRAHPESPYGRLMQQRLGQDLK